MHLRSLCADVLLGAQLYSAERDSREQLQSIYGALHERATSFRGGSKLSGLNSSGQMHAASRPAGRWPLRFGLRETPPCSLRTSLVVLAKKAGDELIDLWNTSSRYSVEELARLIGMGDLSFDLLADVTNNGLKRSLNSEEHPSDVCRHRFMNTRSRSVTACFKALGREARRCMGPKVPPGGNNFQSTSL